ncbi:MAG: glycoside hydrolase family 9 protein [Leptolyngbyaceae cyanobacterium]
MISSFPRTYSWATQRKRRFSAWLLFSATLLTVIFGGCGSLPYDTFASPPDILIDQFGYRPGDRKVAVIQQAHASPEDEPALYRHLSDDYQVIEVNHPSRIIFEAPAQLWNDGKIHCQSGDRAAWFDFSTVQKPGQYVIRNARTTATSVPFEISQSVYQDVLVTATRMFFYQRSGFAKETPYADARWTDGAAFLGPRQDTEARFVDDKDNPDLARDMRGGWFDAGDTNKYVTFAAQPIHQLLEAYTRNPSVWTDDFNLPESNNNIPDVLDEVQFELDWFQRMQATDGGVFIKLGTLEADAAKRPSLDKRPRFYGPKCSSSTIALASTFAHAAFVFQTIPALQPQATQLQNQSLRAWDWFMSNPIQTECDTQEIRAGDADRPENEQIGLAVIAAVYLSQLTDDERFHNYVRDYFRETRSLTDAYGALYEPFVVDALMAYQVFGSAPSEVRRAIKAALTQQFSQTPELFSNSPLAQDPYRAFLPDDQYHWGSNVVKSNLGNVNSAIHDYAIDAENASVYRDRALNILHYLHGVNPLGIVYLTNMYEHGAEFAANEMFHEWFGKGIYSNAKTSPNGPAPGFLTGGPNKNYTGSAPLADRPPMRAYLDENDPELRMWEISEPSTGYQSAYVQLLTNFQASSG